jgi:hypothetical protein
MPKQAQSHQGASREYPEKWSLRANTRRMLQARAHNLFLFIEAVGGLAVVRCYCLLP